MYSTWILIFDTDQTQICSAGPIEQLPAQTLAQVLEHLPAQTLEQVLEQLPAQTIEQVL